MSNKLAIFDLDNTLLAGDSDYAWGEFLVDQGIVNKNYYTKKNQQFYDDYTAGCLDINAFLHFSLQPLANNPLDRMIQLREQFVESVVENMILPQAEALVEHHREQGHVLLIITATNTFVTQPIAARFGIHHLIGTEPEMKNNAYTGAVSGTPSFQEGKIERFHSWLRAQDIHSDFSWFYSDSHNDIPLLSKVNKAVAVDPDDTLRMHAIENNWDIISLR